MNSRPIRKLSLWTVWTRPEAARQRAVEGPGFVGQSGQPLGDEL